MVKKKFNNPVFGENTVEIKDNGKGGMNVIVGDVHLEYTSFDLFGDDISSVEDIDEVTFIGAWFNHNIARDVLLGRYRMELEDYTCDDLEELLSAVGKLYDMGLDLLDVRHVYDIAHSIYERKFSF